jgi:hypothetical protein
MAQTDLDAIMDFLESGSGAAAASSEKTQPSKLKLPAKVAPMIKRVDTSYPVGDIHKPDTLEHIAYGK